MKYFILNNSIFAAIGLETKALTKHFSLVQSGIFMEAFICNTEQAIS